MGSSKEVEIRKALNRSKISSSTATGVKMETRHPEAHNWIDVVVAVFKNSHLIASIFSAMIRE